MSQGKLLLVDDSPSIRMMLEDKLSEDGYTVYCAENGREAIDMLDIFTPDMIITDVSMPEMDGFALCRHLNETPGAMDIPIIILTAATEERDVCEGLGLGAADYIRKPFSPAELTLRVKNILVGVREKSRLQEIFARHASPAVVKELLDRTDDLMLSGELCEAVILFADIRGFTRIASKAEPEYVVRELNRYLTVMSEAVMEEGGTLDKFMGDGIMAIFGAPLKHEDAAARAVRSAVRMQTGIADINRERAADGKEEMLVGVGINSGPAVVGSIGSPSRMDYTAIGDCVNVAARLQGFAHGGQIIISEEVCEQVSGEVETVAMEPVMVKGKSEPIKIYAVVVK
jgi:adenylate cyclase